MTSTAACNLGVLAFGDSITNGGGELQWGVALQSWALWVARALAIPFTSHAVDGARAADVVGLQIPMFEQHTACSAGCYDVGCLYIGVNDVRAVDWNPHAFASDFRVALHFLVARCDRVLTVKAPLDLGRPRAGVKVQALNSIIHAAAGELGALVVDLEDFKARNLVMPDHVHPTAFGQIAIAERALAVLARDGLPARVWPRALISYKTSWGRRLQADLTYLYRHGKVTAAAVRASMRR